MKTRAPAQPGRSKSPPRAPAAPAVAGPARLALPAGMQRWLAIVLLVAAPLAALAPVCTHEFLNYDDADQVAGNPLYRPVTWHSLETWWTTPRMDLYMPVTNTVWGLIALDAYQPARDAMPAHLDPVPFHVANLAAHVLCGLVVFVLLEMLIDGLWPAVIGALLFELHPMQVEAVAWMSELNTVLSALLAFCAVWQYLKAVRQKIGAGVYNSGLQRRDRSPWRWHYTAAMLLYLLAMLAKPGAVVAPLIAGTLDVMILRRSWRRSVRWLWPWAVLAAACVLETVIFQNGGAARWNVAWYQRPVVALDSLAFYVQKLFWPSGLAVDYGLRPAALLHDHWLLVKCLVLAAIVLVLWRVRRSARPVAAGGVVFLIPLLPMLGLITFDFQWYSNVADHYLYMPMLGAAIVAAWACRRWNRWPTYALAGVALAALGIASNLQASVWEDTESLFAHNLAVNPTSALAINQFTRLSLDAKDPTTALAYARQEIALHPDDDFAWRASGLAFAQLSPPEWANAAEAFSRARKLSPDNPLTLEDLAGALMELKQYARAEEVERQAIALDPDFAEAHHNLSLILKRDGKLSEALAEAQRAHILAGRAGNGGRMIERGVSK